MDKNNRVNEYERIKKFNAALNQLRTGQLSHLTDAEDAELLETAKQLTEIELSPDPQRSGEIRQHLVELATRLKAEDPVQIQNLSKEIPMYIPSNRYSTAPIDNRKRQHHPVSALVAVMTLVASVLLVLFFFIASPNQPFATISHGSTTPTPSPSKETAAMEALLMQLAALSPNQPDTLIYVGQMPVIGPVELPIPSNSTAIGGIVYTRDAYYSAQMSFVVEGEAAQVSEMLVQQSVELGWREATNPEDLPNVAVERPFERREFCRDASGYFLMIAMQAGTAGFTNVDMRIEGVDSGLCPTTVQATAVSTQATAVSTSLPDDLPPTAHATTAPAEQRSPNVEIVGNKTFETLNQMLVSFDGLVSPHLEEQAYFLEALPDNLPLPVILPDNSQLIGSLTTSERFAYRAQVFFLSDDSWEEVLTWYESNLPISDWALQTSGDRTSYCFRGDQGYLSLHQTYSGYMLNLAAGTAVPCANSPQG